MRKVLALVLGAVAVIGLVWFGYQKTSNPVQYSNDGKPIIKIGVLLPLSGNSAFAGLPVRKAIEVALGDAKKEKTLKYDYELIFDDTQNVQKQSLLNAIRLVNVNKVNGILSMWSPAGLVVSPFAEKKKLPHLGCSWGYEVAKGQYNFNHATFPEEQVAVLIEQLKKHNIKKIGLIWDADKGNQDIIDLLNDSLPKNSMDVVFDTMLPRGGMDYKTEILKMKQKDADMVLIFMLPPGINRLVQQMQEADYKVPVSTVEYFSFAPELFERTWYVGDALGDDKFARYMKREIGYELNSCMANLYDGLKMMIDGFENAGVEQAKGIPDGETVVNEMLHNRDFRSITGKIRIDADGNVHTEPVVKKIINGKPVEVRE